MSILKLFIAVAKTVTEVAPIRVVGIEIIALTLILLTLTKWRAPTNASKWRMGFNPYPADVDNMASSYQC